MHLLSLLEAKNAIQNEDIRIKIKAPFSNGTRYNLFINPERASYKFGTTVELYLF